MRILIAGGAGYIGSVLVPKLQARSYQVDVLDLLWFGNSLPAGTRVMQKDVMSASPDDLKGYDCVIFLAGLSNDPMASYSTANNFIGNAAAPAYLAYIAKQAGVRRFIYGGSCSVYGYAVDEFYDEQAPTICQYPYGISKLLGEHGCLCLQDGSFSAIVLRQGTVCGHSPRMRLDLVINTMFSHAVRDCAITVTNPSIWRPVLAVQDAASAYIRAIEANEEISGIFNIASGNYTLGELADLVRDGVREFHGTEARLEIRNMQDLRNYKVNCRRANEVLGFHPRFDAKDIVGELAANLQHFSDFDNDTYYNIRVFTKLEASGEAGLIDTRTPKLGAP